MAETSPLPELLTIGLDHLPQLLLQIADLVAQPGRELELQIGRRRVHLIGQLLHEIGQVTRRHASQLPGVRRGVLGPQ